LLAVLHPVHEAVAKRAVHCDRGICGQAHASRQRGIAVVSRQREEWIQIGTQSVGRCQVQCVIAFGHIEGAVNQADEDQERPGGNLFASVTETET